MKYLILVLLLVGAVKAAISQPAQIILLRHAEKPWDPASVHLSQEGQKRAEDLVPFLTTDPALTKYGLPVALYATHTTKHGHGQRPQETIAPLSKTLHLPVLAPYASDDYARLAKAVLTNPKYQGKTVLICWVHDYIPQLAGALGVRPEPPRWKGEVYDRLFLISYEKGKAVLKEVPQVFSAEQKERK